VRRLSSIVNKICIFVVVSILISACDKGKESLDKVHAQYRRTFEGPVTLENFAEAQKALAVLKALAAAHSQSASGRQALAEANELSLKIIKVGEELSPLVSKCLSRSHEAEVAAEEITDTIQADIRRKTRKSAHHRFHVREKDCLAHLHLSTDFKKASSLYDVELLKVEQIRAGNMLVKPLYRAHAGERVLSNWREQLRSRPSHEHAKSFFNVRTIPIECSRADAAVEAFHRYAMLMGQCADYGEKLNFITNVMKLSTPIKK